MRGVSRISKFERENISFTQNLPLGRKGCIRGIVWLFFAVHPGTRVEYTSAASIIDDYTSVGKKRRVHTYGCSRASATIVTSDFSALEVAIVVAAYQHACRRVSGLREYAPWFVCRWLLASVVSCRALGSFARQRLIFFVSAAIVREMIHRWLSVALNEPAAYCRCINWPRSGIIKKGYRSFDMPIMRRLCSHWTIFFTGLPALHVVRYFTIMRV